MSHFLFCIQKTLSNQVILDEPVMFPKETPPTMPCALNSRLHDRRFIDFHVIRNTMAMNTAMAIKQPAASSVWLLEEADALGALEDVVLAPADLP